jgi:hypothetical protein
LVRSEGVKFTGSLDINGNNITKQKKSNNTIIFIMSLYKKRVLNFNLAKSEKPKGEDLPLSCKNNK